MGLVALWHVWSSQTRARTHVPCVGRWILKSCATREVPSPCTSGGVDSIMMFSLPLLIPPPFLQRWACDPGLANQTLISFKPLGRCHMTQAKPIRSFWSSFETFWLAWSEKRHAFSFLLKLELWECKPSFSRSHLGGDYLSTNRPTQGGCRHERWRDTWSWWHCLSSWIQPYLKPATPVIYIFMS